MRDGLVGVDACEPRPLRAVRRDEGVDILINCYEGSLRL